MPIFKLQLDVHFFFSLKATSGSKLDFGFCSPEVSRLMAESSLIRAVDLFLTDEVLSTCHTSKLPAEGLQSKGGDIANESRGSRVLILDGTKKWNESCYHVADPCLVGIGSTCSLVTNRPKRFVYLKKQPFILPNG